MYKYEWDVYNVCHPQKSLLTKVNFKPIPRKTSLCILKWKNKLGMFECCWEICQNRKEEICLYLSTTNGKSFLFVLNILNFARGTRINSSLILNILIGWAVEYCVDVVFYYFLLADNCYKCYEKCCLLLPRFELVLLSPFTTMVAITSRAPSAASCSYEGVG